MKETLNSYVFSNADETIKKLTLAIRKAIDGSKFEGKVFLCGGTVRNLILGVENDGTYEIAVETHDGGVSFSKWITKKINKTSDKNNPVINNEWGLGMFTLDVDDDISEITIEASQTMKMWPESTNIPIGQLYGTLLEDAMTRDYTINAIYYDISADRILDKTNHGLFDLSSRVLRTVKAPGYAFKCSPIRMMRGIRFACNYKFSFERDTWLGMLKNSKFIEECEKRDIKSELNKILLSDKPSVGLWRMFYSGLLKRTLPDVYGLNAEIESYTDGTTFLDHTFKVVDTVFPTIENRLSALMHDVGEPFNVSGVGHQDVDDFSADCAYEVLGDLGYGIKIRNKVVTAIQNHRFFMSYPDNLVPNSKKIKMFLELCKGDYPMVLDLMNAENICSKLNPRPKHVLHLIKKIEEVEKKMEAEAEKLSKDPLPVTGEDVMKSLKIKPGPIIGFIIKKVTKKFDKGELADKVECLDYAGAVYEKYKDKF